MKINMQETPHSTRKSGTCIVCICFCMCGRQNPEYSNWSSMADDAITQGGIGGPGCPV